MISLIDLRAYEYCYLLHGTGHGKRIMEKKLNLFGHVECQITDCCNRWCLE